MEGLKKNWLSILLLVILLYVLIYSKFIEGKYSEEIIALETKIENLEKLNNTLLITIDSLSSIDSSLVDDIVEIQIIEHERIKMVDTMSISSLQGYFSDNYPKK